MKNCLDDILARAAAKGAGSVLFLVGRPPVMRFGRDLQPPEEETALSFYDTQEIAQRVLSGQPLQALEENGSVEVPFEIGQTKGRVTVFYGQGSHNLVFYLD